MSQIANCAIVIPFLVAPVCYALGRIQPKWRNSFVLFALALNLALTLVLMATVVASGSFSTALFTISVADFTLPVGPALNPFSAGLMLAVAIVLLAIGIYSCHTQIPRQHSLYFALLLLTTGALNGFVAARDLVSLFVFWEIVGLAFVFLVMTDLNPRATNAGLKMLVANEIASMVLLMGILLTVANFRLTELGRVANWLAEDSTGPRDWIVALLFAATAFRAALVPLHSWFPTSVGNSRFSVVALLSGTLTVTGLYAMVRLLSPTVLARPEWAHVIGIIGIVSVLIGGYLALHQNDIRKTLGYFYISQSGLVALGLGMGSILGSAAAVIQVITIAFTAPLVVLSLAVLLREQTTTTSLHEPTKIWPIPAMTLSVGTLAAIGLPPLMGFGSHWLLFETALTNADWWTGVFAITILIGMALNIVLVVRWILSFSGQSVSEGHGLAPQAPLAIMLATLAAIVSLGVIPWALFLQQVVAPITTLVTATPVPELAPQGWQCIGAVCLVYIGLIAGVVLSFTWAGTSIAVVDRSAAPKNPNSTGQFASPLIEKYWQWTDDGELDLYSILSSPVLLVSKIISGITRLFTQRMGGW